MNLRRGAAFAAAALLLLLSGRSAHALEAGPDQRDPRHLTAETVDPGLYRFAPAAFTPGLPPVALQGPDRAKGLVIWQHGRDVAKEAQAIAPPLAWEFARSGWDVYATARLGTHDVRAVARRIIARGLEEGRALGYRQIVLMGQSAGGFLALEVATTRRDLTGVIALAPAAYGEIGKVPETGWARNDSDLAAFWPRLATGGGKIAVAFFADDPFFERARPGLRGEKAAAQLSAAGLPHMVMAEPLPRFLRGHAAGLTPAFARRFAPCLLIFMAETRPPPCADHDRAALATFGIVPPASSPAPADMFGGLWQGTSTTGRFIAVDIAGAAGGGRQMRYMLGRGLNTEPPETITLPLQPVAGGLGWRQPPLSFDVTAQPDGSLLARRADARNPAQPPTETRLSRLN